MSVELIERPDEVTATPPAPTASPTIDVVVPVYDEERTLGASIRRLHAYLTAGFPFSWRITIVDNASTDQTAAVAAVLADELDGVRFVHLDRKGRGLALRTAWSESDAAVVAYMDVDLSTGLDALLPLVAPLVSGHSDVAIGSRLAPGANVARGTKREAISRIYNLLLHTVFANRFHDAQCGFKAVRADVARRLLPEVRDDAWFFDTELLLLAEHNGLRIHEVPVDWVDDPDTRVHVTSTAIEDLKGTARVARRFATGHGAVDLGPLSRSPVTDDFGRSVAVFGLVGAISTVVSLVLFLLLRPALGPTAAVIVALGATAVGNSWAHRRFSFGRRGREGLVRHAVASAALAVAGIAVSIAVLAAVAAAGGSLALEVVALALVWGPVTLLRFRVLSGRSRP
ncbi:MAG: glycosyltransferase family 2 protein [Acidimicrobiales bacterium]